MKLQMTAIASALTLTMAMGASAAGPLPDYDTGFGGSNTAGSSTFNHQEGKRSSMNGFGHSAGRTSVIKQVNATTNSNAVANQAGDNQYSRIRQSGVNLGDADVRQGQGGAERNESIVLQSNSATGLTAKVQQVGTGGLNDSYINQNGEGHLADVVQRNSQGSDSVIYQRGTGGHNADVDQINSTARSYITQRGGVKHNATVYQNNATGATTSWVYQADDGTKGVGHVADVRQVNEVNSLSMIRQNSNYGGMATASHTQSGGSNNTAISFQW